MSLWEFMERRVRNGYGCNFFSSAFVSHPLVCTTKMSQLTQDIQEAKKKNLLISHIPLCLMNWGWGCIPSTLVSFHHYTQFPKKNI